jgi:hypothetical protein
MPIRETLHTFLFMWNINIYKELIININKKTTLIGGLIIISLASTKRLER